MSEIMTNFRAEDMPGAAKPVAKKVAPAPAKKAAPAPKKVEEAPVVVEEAPVVEDAPVEADAE